MQFCSSKCNFSLFKCKFALSNAVLHFPSANFHIQVQIAHQKCNFALPKLRACFEIGSDVKKRYLLA